MEIGDIVLHHGRRYVLCGFTYASSTEQHAVLENPETGELSTVRLDEVEAALGAAE